MTTPQDIHDRIVGQNVPKRFLKTVARVADSNALRWKDGSGSWQFQTFGELAAEAASVAAGLRELGVGPGDTVVMMLRNRREFFPVDLGVLLLGATPVSIYNSSAPEQIEYLVNDCKAKVAVVEDPDFLGRFMKVAEQTPTIENMVIVDADDSVGDDVLRYAALAEAAPLDLETEAATADLDTLATIIYTSGTTGPPKGVMLSHSNVCYTLEGIGETMRNEAGIESFEGMRHLSYLPMAHIMERLLGYYYMLEFGTEVTCCPDTAAMPEFLREVKPNIFVGVPRVWEKLYAGVNAALSLDPEKAQQFNDGVAAAMPIMEKMTRGEASEEEIGTWNFLDQVAFSQVRPLIGLDEAVICITGAAPLPAEIMNWFRAIGVPLSEGYGMSETMAVLTWAHAAKPGFVGKPGVGVELKIAEDGEVIARGGNMFVGYLNQPEKTAETIDTDGWVHTGDIGEIDDEGYLKIVDRKKELIITAGGKNVSPANLEAAIKMIPLVGQACAIGDQKPFMSALVVLDPDAARSWAAAHGLEGDAASLSALAENPDVIAEINAGLAEAMAGFNNAEAVKKVKVLGEEWMPDSELLTPTSKLKRRGIKQRFEAEIEALYA